MGSFVMTGSTSGTSTAFDVTRASYEAYKYPSTEAYLTITTTVSVAVQQADGTGTFRTFNDLVFTGPAAKLITLRAGRQARIHVQAAAADFRVELEW